MTTHPTCNRTDCINRETYTDCYLIGTEYCRFYERIKRFGKREQVLCGDIRMFNGGRK